MSVYLIPYDYSLEDVRTVALSVAAYAGVGKLQQPDTVVQDTTVQDTTAAINLHNRMERVTRKIILN
ncbi:MAG: hypothetical protein P1P82_10415 [Bacteroidales bacterium]|nr:hypothetical protein [Bacteroidales bacterium]MDT8430971.1 hypothetical protein [Bacteroidales bacterium]